MIHGSENVKIVDALTTLHLGAFA